MFIRLSNRLERVSMPVRAFLDSDPGHVRAGIDRTQRFNARQGIS